MEKLVYIHSGGDEPYYFTNYLCFTYESKDKFIFDVLELVKENREHLSIMEGEGHHRYHVNTVELFPEVRLNIHELEDIEHCVYTLNEWFGRKVDTPKLSL